MKSLGNLKKREDGQGHTVRCNSSGMLQMNAPLWISDSWASLLPGINTLLTSLFGKGWTGQWRLMNGSICFQE